MTLEQLGNLGEAIGGIAVVISLIALTFQMRQNTKAIRAESARAAEADWSARDMEMFVHMQPGFFLKVHTAQSVAELTLEELIKAQVFLRSLWHQLTSEYYLYVNVCMIKRSGTGG